MKKCWQTKGKMHVGWKCHISFHYAKTTMKKTALGPNLKNQIANILIGWSVPCALYKWMSKCGPFAEIGGLEGVYLPFSACCKHFSYTQYISMVFIVNGLVLFGSQWKKIVVKLSYYFCMNCRRSKYHDSEKKQTQSLFCTQSHSHIVIVFNFYCALVHLIDGKLMCLIASYELCL